MQSQFLCVVYLILAMIPLGVWVVRRLQSDFKFSAGGEKFKFKYVKQSLLDWKTWIASEFFCMDTCVSSHHNSCSAYLHGLVSAMTREVKS